VSGKRASAFLPTGEKTKGYRYALSASGLAVGRDILGRFFEENRGKSPTQVREAACEFFYPYRHMVRPAVSFGGDAPHGTIEDQKAAVCFDISGRPYALIVWVRIGQTLQAVLMPEVKHPDSAKPYWDFLNNETETLPAHEASFDTENGHWVVWQFRSRHSGRRKAAFSTLGKVNWPG
jgi:hypothetical protein